jgi:hypothetical protein
MNATIVAYTSPVIPVVCLVCLLVNHVKKFSYIIFMSHSIEVYIACLSMRTLRIVNSFTIEFIRKDFISVLAVWMTSSMSASNYDWFSWWLGVLLSEKLEILILRFYLLIEKSRAIKKLSGNLVETSIWLWTSEIFIKNSN